MGEKSSVYGDTTEIMANLKQIGNIGEDWGAAYLQSKGFTVRERNFRTRWGEIDIVAVKGGEWYFVEVKTRASRSHGSPLESMPAYRVGRLQKMALLYLTKHGLGETNAHLSLLGIDCADGEPQFSFLPNITE